MAKGLCWHCDEKWHRGYQFKQKKILIIEPIENFKEEDDFDEERSHETLTILVYDGSDHIPCILFLQPQPEQGDDLGVAAEITRGQAASVDLGKLVRVRGKITLSPDGALQLTASSVIVKRGPNAQTLHILECIEQASSVYDQP
ncbi:hypothetical protein ZIOFF_018562 [Zingiber officinale]|uniref:Uncharacterized protein n=1 Tax=Zingiber officinale TaxID=94328 RepID=A0A8J5LM24_ZINOF|nr:hypothetical protein ZIOFF_018562 [Zingiber officinale]